MQQASDFLAESEALEQLIAPLQASDFSHPTGFKSWTFETIMRHLHFWNHMANLALTAPDAFQAELKPAVEAMMAGKTLPDIELVKFPEGGLDLVSLWQTGFREVAAAYQQADPSDRVAWVGPSMSARSSITARQMETWAHGQAIYDELGRVRANTDRLHNIIILGINTFGWTFKVRGESAPEQMPYVELTAPSGTLWTFGDENSASTIKGAAEEFAQVVTQTRHVEDTQLCYEGEDAKRWLYNAQCFAGGPNPPPAPGSRFIRID